MDFELSEELELIRDTAREFAETELMPNAGRWDQEAYYPAEALRQAGELGLCGMTIPEEYGGAEMGNLALCVAMEEINRGCASCGVTLSVHNSLLGTPITKYGTEDQKRRFLPKLASGEWIGAYSLTEPQAGSDAANVQTFAERQGDEYVLNGTKIWVTTGDKAGLIILYARTDRESRSHGMTAFIVEPDSSPGLKVGAKEIKMGIRASSTVELICEDLRVPVANRLGDEGQGLPIALETLDGGRIGIASQALGIHRACLEESLKYAQEREQFNRPIAAFQAIQWKLADMATELDAARLMVWRAATLRDQGRPCSLEAAMAKSMASRACNKAADEAVQIHGGAGYTTDFSVERHFRDARITEIYEGVTDIQRLVIARKLLS